MPSPQALFASSLELIPEQAQPSSHGKARRYQGRHVTERPTHMDRLHSRYGRILDPRSRMASGEAAIRTTTGKVHVNCQSGLLPRTQSIQTAPSTAREANNARMAARVNYDQIAATYDARFASGLYDGVLAALRTLVTAKKPFRTLEVGCGTGHWLSALHDLRLRLYGLDYSFEMLHKAHERDSHNGLVRATADILPFRDPAFDLIFCVNAIHHFDRLDGFIAEARRLLRRGGTLAVIGMDPHHGRDYWCVYDYFPETKVTDLARYPSSGQITDAMLRAGFDHVGCEVACHFTEARLGRAVFDDPELQRRGCSQMALLTDEEYAAGIERIRSILRSSKLDEPPVFKVDIAMMMQCGHVAL
jgi:ubiquinone/menaquinone biosynthesis C-methylase UbiE